MNNNNNPLSLLEKINLMKKNTLTVTIEKHCTCGKSECMRKYTPKHMFIPQAVPDWLHDQYLDRIDRPEYNKKKGVGMDTPGWHPTELNFGELEERIAVNAEWKEKSCKDIMVDMVKATELCRCEPPNIMIVAAPHVFHDVSKIMKEVLLLGNKIKLAKQVAPSFFKNTTLKSCNMLNGMNHTLLILDELHDTQKDLNILKKVAKEASIEKPSLKESTIDVNIKSRRPKWLN